MRFSSAAEISVPFRSRRLRFGDFHSSRWPFHPLARTSFPVPVALSRLAALRFVFNFGMAKTIP